MGRRSSSGSRFLVRRKGTNRWTYHRNLPADAAPKVIGEVRLYWSGKVARLRGRRAIAISLGTSDQREAERRRDQIHAEIETQVARAIEMVRQTGIVPHTTRVIPSLSPEHHKTIGDWVYAYSLAAQDAELVENPDDPEGNADIFAWMERARAEDATIGTERETMERMLARRNFDPTDPNDRSRGSEIEELLEDMGIELPDPEQQRLVALVVLRARRRAFHALQRRQAGEPVDTPPASPAPPMLFKEEARPATMSGPLLRATFEEFVVKRGMKRHTANDYRNQLNRFVDLFNDIPVASVTRKQVFDFATELEKFPARYPEAWRGKRVQEIVKLASSRPDLKRLAPQTINDRSIGALKSFFSWCIRRQIIEVNPAVGVALDVPKSAEKPRDPYSIDHLRLIFSQPVFTQGERPKRGCGEAMYWLPLIALYSGMRLEEIGQLRLEDIGFEDGVHYFNVREGVDQSLKTSSSARRVPIHKKLIERGILKEKDRLQKLGEPRLFPQLKRNREDKYTAGFSKWWGIWTRGIGISDDRLVFHSFRHAFKDRCRDCQISRDHSESIMGHAGQSVGDSYGKGFALVTLAQAMANINWDPVFEHDTE